MRDVITRVITFTRRGPIDASFISFRGARERETLTEDVRLKGSSRFAGDGYESNAG